LFNRALAGSAPILQFPGIYNCSGYFDIITNDFKKYSQKCSQTIRNSWDAVRRLAKTDEGLKWLTETFVLCESLKVSDTNTFISWLSSTWESLAMIDYPNAASFLQPLPPYPIGVSHQIYHIRFYMQKIYLNLFYFYYFVLMTATEFLQELINYFNQTCLLCTYIIKIRNSLFY
jgi:hypothetical protein